MLGQCSSGFEEAAILGAIDAMIYDIACALDFTKLEGKLEIGLCITRVY